MNYISYLSPFKHGLSKSFLDKELADKIHAEFPSWDDIIWDKYGKIFKSDYGYKKELTDRNFFSPSIKLFFSIIETKKFINTLSASFGLKGLFIDQTLYGGGLNIYPPGSYLSPHIDYNYDNDLKAYRVINLIFYVNKDWSKEKGGCLEICTKKNGRKKIIAPELNKCIIFAQNKNTIHGVTTTKDFYRKSISIWYYSKIVPPNIQKKPHKTIWIKLDD